MTSQRSVPQFLWRVLRVIGLCGTLAFLISVASPADDDVQQEFLACRTRQRTVRLQQVTHPSAAAGRIVPVNALLITCGWQQPARTPIDIAIDLYQLPGAISAHQTGDRSPPAAIL
jgi:hypothetical protein